MRSSDELKHFWKFVNAVDVLDAIKNEVMVWVTDEGEFEVDFSIFGKKAKVRLSVEEAEECILYVYDENGNYDKTVVVDCDSPEEYTKLAERMIAYLHNSEGDF